MTMSKQEKNPAKYDSDNSKFVSEKRTNIKSDLIEITHDKLENILLKHLDKLNVRRGWIAPLTLFVTILVSIFSSNFTQYLGLSKGFWQALFTIGLIGSGGWVIYKVIRLFYYWDKSKINYLMKVIKNADIEE